jgi:ParB family transcriptional regulator, chromosome partitioning protein
MSTRRARRSPASMSVDEIRVGRRHRRDLGDVDALAASMRELGLLHPIVVTPDGLLLCGERRLCAARLLGWNKIPVTIRSAP